MFGELPCMLGMAAVAERDKVIRLICSSVNNRASVMQFEIVTDVAASAFMTIPI